MKALLMAGSVAATLMAAVGCQSTEYSGAQTNADRDAQIAGATSLANTSEGDLGPPRPGDDATQVRTPGDWVVLGEKKVDSRMTPADTAIPDLKNATVDPIDKQFMIEASMSSQFGIESGKVALKKSESGKIRELANKIINDSMNANNEIRRMAAERSVVVPSQLDQAHRELVTRLEQTDKATFDTEFLRMQASAHREAIQLFETQSQAGKDEASKQFARNNLPALQAHLTEAESPFNTASEK